MATSKSLAGPGPARRIDARRAVRAPPPPGRSRRPAPAARRPWQPPAPSARRWPRTSCRSPRAPASPSSPADTTPSPCGATRSRISRTLPGLWLATTSGVPRLWACACSPSPPASEASGRDEAGPCHLRIAPRRRDDAAGAECRASVGAVIRPAPRCAARRTPGSCRRGRGNRWSVRPWATRSRPRWRCPCPPAARFHASISLAAARKQMWPSPSMPCGGTGSASGAGGTVVTLGLKISSTWSPQR